MKLLVGVALVAGAVVLAKRHALRRDGFDFETILERMPDNAPPKWAFQNITAIRENTDRILELLDSTPKVDAGGAAMPRHDEGSN